MPRPALLAGLLLCACGATLLEWVDPPDGATLAQKPEEILIMFSEPMAPSLGASLSICSQADAAAGCEASCSSRPASHEEGFRMQRSNRLASWPTEDLAFKAGCRYVFSLQQGAFSTERQPAEALPASTWGLAYFVQAPRLLEALLHQTETSALHIALKWDSDVSFTCRAQPLFPSTSLPRETEPQVATRNVQVLTELPGLIPGQSYAVDCTGTPAGAQSGWSSVGTLSTLQDTNSRLAGLRVRTAPLCSDGRQLAFADQLVMPVFSPDALAYEVVVFLADLSASCGGQALGDAEWLVSVEPRKDSSFSTISSTYSGGTEVGGFRKLLLPSSSGSASFRAAFQVQAHARSTPPRSYSVSVRAERAGTQGDAAPPAATPSPTPAPAPAWPTAAPPGDAATTTTAAVSEAPCPDVEEQLGDTQLRTTCASSMNHGQSCYLICPAGQTVIGGYTCQYGLLLGSPSCSEPGARTETVTKLAGALRLELSSSVVTPEMEAAAKRSLAAGLGLDAADVARAELAKFPASGGALRRRLSQEALRLRYELVLRDPAMLTGLASSLNDLASQSMSVEQYRFKAALAEDGFTLNAVSVAQAPMTFQERVLVTATPAPDPAPDPAPAPVPNPVPAPAPAPGTLQRNQGTGDGSEQGVDEPSESSGIGTGAIVGIAFGALAGVALLGLAVFYFFRRQGFANL